MRTAQNLSLWLVLASTAAALPQQAVFYAVPDPIKNDLDPLKHLSAISPFFIPAEEPTPPPATCNITAATLLIRHSSILGNDDEYEMTMQPFIKKLAKLGRSNLPKDKNHPWYFLRNWKSPLQEKEVEKLSKQGAVDAEAFGKYVRSLYPHLFPPEKYHKAGDHNRHSHDRCESSSSPPCKNPKHKKPGPPYKIWTASSSRDIDTAQAYIKGAFPRHQAGKDGDGDGVNVQLIEVPNKLRDWAKSLTPHKACDAFEKESSLPPAETWLNVYAPRVISRLKHVVPGLATELSNMDILAMQELCGYETIATGNSEFCKVFTDEEWLDVEYYFDVRFHYMMGYGQPLAPYLGMPWVQTAHHLLAGDVDDDDDDGHSSLFAVTHIKKGKKGKKGGKDQPLPLPKLPPNGTHTQLLHTFFTHRESPAFVATFLNLYNGTGSTDSLGPPYVGGIELSLTHRVEPRPWRTSELVPFLGHIAIERLHSESGDNQDYVRVLVNGKMERMPGCEDGLDGTCKWDTWEQWLQTRKDTFHGFEKICNGTAEPQRRK